MFKKNQFWYLFIIRLKFDCDSHWVGNQNFPPSSMKFLYKKLELFFCKIFISELSYNNSKLNGTWFLHSICFHSFTIRIQSSKLMKILSGDVHDFTRFTGSDEKKILFGLNSQSPFRFHPLLIMIRDEVTLLIWAYRRISNPAISKL